MYLTSSNSAAVLNPIVTDEKLDSAESTGGYFLLENLEVCDGPGGCEITGDILPAAPPSHRLLANCSVRPFHLGQMWRKKGLGNLRSSQIRSDRARNRHYRTAAESMLAQAWSSCRRTELTEEESRRADRGTDATVSARYCPSILSRCQISHPMVCCCDVFSGRTTKTGDSALAIPFFNNSSHSSRRPSGSKLVASNGTGVGHEGCELQMGGDACQC